jgi:FAD/FMN-containing dehydrogenase
MVACLEPLVCNDAHSRLNPTEFAELIRVRHADDIRRALARARAARMPCIALGSRHAMGGQQFAQGGIGLDTTRLDRVVAFDRRRGLVTVQAGIRWPALQAFLAAQRDEQGLGWSIAQKQTGADEFSLGGSVSANIHGRGLDRPPLVADLERIALIAPDGERIEADRARYPEHFALAVGGYGLFGVLEEATLRLVPRRKLERCVDICERDDLIARLERRIAAGHRYGDFQFAVDAAREDFLRRGVLSTYRELPDDAEMADAQHRLDADTWRELLYLAHVDKHAAFERYAAFYRRTHGQRYWSDDHQFGVYVDGYHLAIDQRLGHVGSELISELYVPRAELAGFLADAAQCLRALRADAIYGTVRLIRRDSETVLAWAREDWACTVFNLHVRHDAAGREQVAQQQRALIDLALARGGSFYLTYHDDATTEQLLRAHPRLIEFLCAKRAHDPHGVLRSAWYRRLIARVQHDA